MLRGFLLLLCLHSFSSLSHSASHACSSHSHTFPPSASLFHIPTFPHQIIAYAETLREEDLASCKRMGSFGAEEIVRVVAEKKGIQSQVRSGRVREWESWRGISSSLSNF